MWRDLHLAHLVVLDAALGELVDMEPEGIAEVADALALLCLEELQRHGQNSMFPACSPKGRKHPSVQPKKVFSSGRSTGGSALLHPCGRGHPAPLGETRPAS